ncbi:RNA polymerase factor sigma-54 [Bacillus sp. RG28]|uniref:RNA polymerase factor sigma-54 n=1 Tax=Gottfriedia endophytica TaxID=2820819 RepID=A0A940SK81_9BACI|nr:RNA polymerase factor sigma-54 [Gottfriedia endophytica]MBP0726800.1 RNA polymerase factor sigma-54 [Gottfriedia endophytica]
MDLQLTQQQTLKLAMTQELRQAITMLQFNAQELTEFLYEQTLENPLVEIETPHTDWNQIKTTKIQNENTKQGIDLYSRKAISLQDDLLSQLQEMKLDKSEHRIVKYLILNLDKNGFLIGADDELASELSVTQEDLNNGLQLLQSFEPDGIGARTVQECLIIQLKRLSKPTQVAEMIIEDYFDLFVNKNWKEMAKKLKVSLPELQSEIDLILTLQPRPGLNYEQDEVNYVAPDLYVERIGDEFVVSLNDKILPRLKLLNDYEDYMAKGNKSEVSSYLKEKNQQVGWLMKSLEERKSTMIEVMNFIVNKQRTFFEKGSAHLRTLTLREAAEELDIHESTVSRTCKNKFVQTPFGLFEMKNFFSQGVVTGNDEDISSTSVQVFIRELVNKENKEKPLSDQKIVELLGEEHGIEISRRTVAKYRDILRIPSSSKRKRFG